MKNCTYTFDGIEIGNILELTLYLLKNYKKYASKINDILFSKVSKKEEICKKIESLQQLSYNLKRRSKENGVISIMNEEPDYSTDSAISILNFLDSEYCRVNDNPLVTPMDINDYKLNSIQDGKSEEEVSKEILNWQVVDEDSMIIHRLACDYSVQNENNRSDFIKEHSSEISSDSRFTDDNLGRLFTVFNKTIRKIRYNLSGSELESKCRIFLNVNLKAKLENCPGFAKDLIGHIDILAVDLFGNISIYNYKTSSLWKGEWSSAKMQKFKYSMVFLQRLLAANGINVNGIQLNIVPIKLDYDEKFENILNIHFDDPYNITLNEKSTYALERYDLNARKFIKNNTSFPELDRTKLENRTNLIMDSLFPKKDVKAKGILKTAEEWIKRAPKAGEELPILIVPIEDEPEHYFDLIINGKTYPISEKTSKNKNKQIKEKVIEHLNELDDNSSYTITALINGINLSYKNGYSSFGNIKGFYGARTTLDVNLAKYFKFTDFNGEKDYEWELLDDLIDYNILLFKNKEGKIDIISLNSNLDLNEIYQFDRKNRTSLLGTYLNDVESGTLTASYGNIEALRVVTLINELIPDWKQQDILLGNIKIINPIYGGLCRTYHFSEFNKHFYSIINELNNVDSELKIENNYKKIKFSDPIIEFINDFHTLVGPTHYSDIYGVLGTTVEELEKGKDDEYARKKAVQDLMIRLQENFLSGTSAENILASVNSKDNVGVASKLFVELSKVYRYLSKEDLIYEIKPLEGVDKNMFTPRTVPDYNVRIVVNNLQTSINMMSNEIESEYNSELRQFIIDFYKESGYTNLENIIVGDENRVFKNLYELDEKGLNTLTFKNPYSREGDLNYLTNSERKFLKKALLYFYKVLPPSARSGSGMKFTGIDDPRIKEFITKHRDYLDVPLEKASVATLRQKGILERLGYHLRRLKDMMKDSSAIWDYFYANTYELERKTMNLTEDGLKSLHIRNKFDVSNQQRDEIIYNDKYGPNFFETNIENLLIDALAARVETEQYNKFLIATKSYLLQLHLLGKEGGDAVQKVVNSEIDWVNDYLKVNIFKDNLSSGKFKMLINALMPLRRAVSDINLAGNLIAYLRDNINGFAENYAKTITHFNTDLKAEYITKAYKYVLPHSNPSAMEVTLLSALCVKYRISNTDVSKITDRLKTGRTGLLNYENWMYSTLRLPDFVNRMVLFVARCMQDGVWDAFSIENNVLKYDWRKDKRFSVYAKGEEYIKNHPEEKKTYLEQESLYKSNIRWYNQEHPKSADEQLLFTDDLPVPYTDANIISIKNVADNIYGSYDRSNKSLSEFGGLGLIFGMYTTWMNGIWNNVFMHPGLYSVSQRHNVQDTNDLGEPLYLNKYNMPVTKDELEEDDPGVPMLKEVPYLVQGQISMLKDLFGHLKNDGVDFTLEYLKANPQVQANMRKLIADILVTLIVALAYKLAIDEAYRDYKKQAEGLEILLNLIVELLYKSSYRAFDTFKGPLNIIEYLGENMNPPMWQVPTKLIIDAGRMVFGDKTFGQFVTGNFGFARSVKDTYALYRRDTQ